MKRLIPLMVFAMLCGVAAAQIPQPVTQATVNVIGGSGNSQYYVWIVAEFPVGNATPSPAFPASRAPSILSTSQYLQVSWFGVSGATSYDVLLTTTDTAPTGQCNCAAVIGDTSTQFNIQSNSLLNYTVNTWPGPPSKPGYVDLQTNGVNNQSQTLFNLIQGTNITLANSGGGVTISATGSLATGFNNIGTGTNTTAAMTVGSGSSIGTSGTGTIAATTASALGATPTLCPSGDLAQGVLANGNATGCTPVAAQAYPSAGVANSTGTAWGTSYAVGTAANDLVQLNASAQLPAVSAANLTNFPTLNQSTTGNAATASALAATPTLCPSGEIAQGVLANGNATGCVASTGHYVLAQNYAAGGSNTWTASTTTYVGLIAHGYYTTTTNETDYLQVQMPVGGTISNLYVTAAGVTQPSTGSMVVTVRKDGANTTLTCTIAAGSSSGCTDTTDSFTFAAGDWITVGLQNNATSVSNTPAAIAVEVQ